MGARSRTAAGKALYVLVPARVSQKQLSHRLPTFLLCEGQRPPACRLDRLLLSLCPTPDLGLNLSCPQGPPPPILPARDEMGPMGSAGRPGWG